MESNLAMTSFTVEFPSPFRNYFSSWQSWQCEPSSHQLVILTSDCSTSRHSGSAPRADHYLSSARHISKPAVSDHHISCTASTCKCVRLAPESTWIDLYVFLVLSIMESKSWLKICVSILIFVFLRCCCNPSSSRLNLCCWPLWSMTPA